MVNRYEHIYQDSWFFFYYAPNDARQGRLVVAHKLSSRRP